MCEIKGHIPVREKVQLTLFGFSTFVCDSLTINGTWQTVTFPQLYFRSLTQTLYSLSLSSPGWPSASFNSFLHPCRFRATTVQFRRYIHKLQMVHKLTFLGIALWERCGLGVTSPLQFILQEQERSYQDVANRCPVQSTSDICRLQQVMGRYLRESLWERDIRVEGCSSDVRTDFLTWQGKWKLTKYF